MKVEGIGGAYGFFADELLCLEALGDDAGGKDGAVESEGSSPSASDGYCIVSGLFPERNFRL